MQVASDHGIRIDDVLEEIADAMFPSTSEFRTKASAVVADAMTVGAELLKMLF
jgi:hypothetical protein